MRGSTPRANPLTEGEIGAVLGRIGLLASGDRLRCVPLDGGVSGLRTSRRFQCSEFQRTLLAVSFLTSAPARGASIFKMMDVSRHKSVDTFRGYVRDAEMFSNHAGNGLRGQT
jgi:hypothetical protein